MSAADAVNDLVVAELVQLPLALDHALAPASDTVVHFETSMKQVRSLDFTCNESQQLRHA